MRVPDSGYIHIRPRNNFSLKSEYMYGGATVSWKVDETGNIVYAFSVCNVIDKYDKKIGRKLAYENLNNDTDDNSNKRFHISMYKLMKLYLKKAFKEEMNQLFKISNIEARDTFFKEILIPNIPFNIFKEHLRFQVSLDYVQKFKHQTMLFGEVNIEDNKMYTIPIYTRTQFNEIENKHDFIEHTQEFYIKDIIDGISIYQHLYFESKNKETFVEIEDADIKTDDEETTKTVTPELVQDLFKALGKTGYLNLSDDEYDEQLKRLTEEVVDIMKETK